MRALNLFSARPHPLAALPFVGLGLGGLTLLTSNSSGAAAVIGYLAGLPLFFLPGLQMALGLEQLSRQRLGYLKLGLWAFIYSLCITPIVTHLTTSLVGQELNLKVGFAMWWAASLIFFYVLRFFLKQPSTLEQSPKRLSSTLGWAVLTYLAIFSVNFLLYPYIPESDSYGALLSLERLQTGVSTLAEEPGGFFISVSLVLNEITQIPLYWLFKLVLPLLSGVYALLFFDLSKSLSPKLRLLGTLAVLSVPVVVQEFLIPRSQSVFLLTLGPALYLISSLTAGERNLRNLWWLITLMGIGIVGYAIHALFLTILLLSLIATATLIWPKVRRNPLESLFAVAVTGVILTPWLNQYNIIGGVGRLFEILWETLASPQWRWWFISSYVNVDGNEVGWPGLSWLFYYGYNMGLLLPVLFLGAITARPKWRAFFGGTMWPYSATLFIYLIVAEVLPRLGLAYLPDRAWLIVALTATFFVPKMLELYSARFKTRWNFTVLVLLATFSIVISSYVTYAKQGWVTTEEYRAAKFIRESTPPNAAFLTQGGNRVMVRYFGNRYQTVPPEEFFMEANQETARKYIEELRQKPIREARANAERKRELEARLTQLIDHLISTTRNEDRIILNNEIGLARDSYEALIQKIRANEQEPRLEGPVYVLYSTNKFNSLYAQRAWWKSSNFYGADLSGFDQFPLVYNKEGVKIWQIR